MAEYTEKQLEIAEKKFEYVYSKHGYYATCNLKNELDPKTDAQLIKIANKVLDRHYKINHEHFLKRLLDENNFDWF